MGFLHRAQQFFGLRKSGIAVPSHADVIREGLGRGVEPVPAAPIRKTESESDEGDHKPYKSPRFGLKSPFALTHKARSYIAEAYPDMANLFHGESDYGYTEWSANGNQFRDISPQKWLEQVRRAEEMIFNPLANRGMQVRTDFIVGGGFKPVATCAEEWAPMVQEVLDEHWQYNNWPSKTRERVWNLGIHGEWIRVIRDDDYTARRVSGEEFTDPKFRVGQFLPQDIACVNLDPWDLEQALSLRFRESVMKDSEGPYGKEFKIMRRLRAGSDTGKIEGQAIHLRINNLLGMSRGLSDLAHVMEWLDMYNVLLMTGTERAQLLLSFVWKVIIDGASDEDLRKKNEELKLFPPQPGEYLVTDGREDWLPLAPNLSGGDITSIARLIFLYGWGGMGLPEHFFAEANNTNRASAAEMSDPVYAWARARRTKIIQDGISLELEYALQRAKKFGKLNSVPDEELCFQVVGADPDPDRYTQAMGAIKGLAEGLAISTGMNALSTQEVRHIMRRAVEDMGIELPAEDANDNEDPMLSADADEIMEESQRIASLLSRMRDPSDKPMAFDDSSHFVTGKGLVAR